MTQNTDTLRSEATKDPKPLCEYYVYILTNETHRLYMESKTLCGQT